MSGPAPRTGLVIVSHSARLADGVVEVAAQMAPDVVLRAAGGTDDGGIGTSYAVVDAAVHELLGVLDGVAVLTDLGSATMTAESVLEALDDVERARVVLADGPLVEGAVAAAVAAQGGADAPAVARTVADAARQLAGADVAGADVAGADVAGAERAGAPSADGPAGGSSGPGTDALPGAGAAPAGTETAARTLTLRNKVGLHARPAALLARLATGLEAEVSINGVDARSVLALMSLGLGIGDPMEVRAQGPGAAAAVDAVAAAVAEGFGEELG